MAIRAVVFDIGGVLELEANVGTAWIKKWEERLQLSSEEMSKRLEGVWKDGDVKDYPEEDLEKGLREVMGMDQMQIDEFVHDLWEWYMGEANVELTEYFRSLRPHYKTALLSNSYAGARQREQERYHFAELVDLIIYSHEVGMSKPDRRIYELTCEQLGVRPDEMIFLDDNERPVAGARELGIHAIRFQNTAQAISDIQQCLQAHSS